MPDRPAAATTRPVSPRRRLRHPAQPLAQGHRRSQGPGAAFSRRAPPSARSSSRYCRCQDTAWSSLRQLARCGCPHGYRGLQPWWEAFDFERLLEIRKRLSTPLAAPETASSSPHNTYHSRPYLTSGSILGEMLVVRPLADVFFTVVGRPGSRRSIDRTAAPGRGGDGCSSRRGENSAGQSGCDGDGSVAPARNGDLITGRGPSAGSEASAYLIV